MGRWLAKVPSTCYGPEGSLLTTRCHISQSEIYADGFYVSKLRVERTQKLETAAALTLHAVLLLQYALPPLSPAVSSCRRLY